MNYLYWTKSISVIQTRHLVYVQTVIMPVIALYLEEDMAFGAVMIFAKEKNYFMITRANVKADQIKNGKWKEYNKHAVLIAEGIYVNNKKHGTWREYYDETGTIMIEEEYIHGIKHGRYASFHQNGQLLSEGKFFDGQRQGYFKVYDEQGNNIRNLLFINNIQIEDSNELIYVEERTAKRKTGT